VSRPRLLLSWSSGKDSAWALHRLRAEAAYEIAGLVTTVNERYQRVAIHAVREELLAAQAAAVGLPLWRVPLPHPCPNDAYERAMRALLARAAAQGVTHMAFGDLYLADVRAYRERQLEGSGVTPVFPLWGTDTGALAREMLGAGVRAVVTCVDPARLPRAVVGRPYDAAFLAGLPAGVDPCGENGEFHTFCHAGPMYAHPLPVRTGEVIERDGFVYADLLAA